MRFTLKRKCKGVWRTFELLYRLVVESFVFVGVGVVECIRVVRMSRRETCETYSSSKSCGDVQRWNTGVVNLGLW